MARWSTRTRICTVTEATNTSIEKKQFQVASFEFRVQNAEAAFPGKGYFTRSPVVVNNRGTWVRFGVNCCFAMQNSRIKRSVFFAAVLIAVTATCLISYRAYRELYNVILEADHIANFKVESFDGRGTLTLRMSGLPMHSGQVVRNITTKSTGDVITVKAHLALVGLAKPISGGMFRYELVVPDSVDEVRFGNSAVSIWTREGKR